jgi:hypothetical protein
MEVWLVRISVGVATALWIAGIMTSVVARLRMTQISLGVR